MWIRVAFVAAAFAVSMPATLYAEQAGQTVGVKQSASASGSAGSRVLQVNDPVFTGDMVRTNQVGTAQLELMDETKLVVGPNSQLAIDRFVFAGQSSARDVTVNAVQGTFRFITGKSQKQAYTINTPVASIGVRGTEFDISVAGDNIAVALYGGAMRMCDYSRPRRCVDLEDACGVITFDPRRGYQWERNVYEKTRMMDTTFIGFRQQALQTDFRVPAGSCEYRQTGPQPRPSGASSGSGNTPPPAYEPPDDGGGDGGPID